MRRAALLVLLPLLGGCAEVWTRPGTSEAESERSLTACDARARTAVPPAYERRLVAAERIERNRTCRQRDGREECRTEETRYPAQYETVDLNAGQRRDWRNGCMANQGYTFAGLRPLRLSPPDETPAAPPLAPRAVAPAPPATLATGPLNAFPPGASPPILGGAKPPALPAY